MYKRRKEDIIRCKLKKKEKELSIEEVAKRMGFDI
nr:MAG TPA: DNA-binding protein [Caudoviricetes sp.]